MLAILAGDDEIKLSEQEKKDLAEAVADVQALYSRSIVSAATAAWVNLAFVGLPIVGSRAIRVMRGGGRNKPRVVANGSVAGSVEIIENRNPTTPQ